MDTLPAELILEIATHLEFTRDIAALSQTNRALHHRLNARVYAHNCQHENGFGLERAVTLNIYSAVSKLLSHGAGSKLPGPSFVRLLTETAIRESSLDIICMLRQHSIDSDGDGDGDGNTALRLPRCTADWMVKQCGIPLSEAIDGDKYNDPRYMAHYQNAEMLDTAIRYDRVDVVRMLIAEGVQPSVHGDRALANAARWGSAELVGVLLEAGCAVDILNERDDPASVSALHRAVSAGKVDTVRILLRAGADLEESDAVSGTPLCLAAERGFCAVVEVLVEAGAVLDSPFSEGVALTPLLRAAEGGHGAVAEYLLRRIDVDSIIRSEGEKAAAGRLSLLAVSSILGYTDLAERILARGHDVNIPREWLGPFRTTRSMLSFAAEHGHIELVSLLLRHGAQFCPEHDGGFYQSLAYAARGAHEAIVRILLEAGAPTDVPIDDAGTTILQLSAETPRIAQLLLDHGATPGPPVLLAALSTGNLALARQLLLRDISLHDFNPVEPLLYAAASGGRAALELLRRHGIGLDPDDADTATEHHYRSPLGAAIRKGAVDTVRYCLFEVAARDDFGFAGFLERNASSLLCVAICDLHGKVCVEMLEILISSLSLSLPATASASLSSSSSSTSTPSSPRAEEQHYKQSLTRAMHVAIQRYHRAAVRLLLSKGADLDWRGGSGTEQKNAWDLAYDKGDRVILELLLEHAYAQVGGGDANALRRYILPVEERARREGYVVAVKAISYFCWRRMYPIP
ncbi:ankyrin repeat-containing domain protein [Aspergillus germanicus]